MKLIVGLGNPGRKYSKTRHNVGFLTIEELHKNLSYKYDNIVPFNHDPKSNSDISKCGGFGGSEIIIFVMPQTFMNNSGETVSKLMQYYKISNDDLLVICDDLDLPLGTIRVRLEGSSGGHKGLESIISQIGDQFARIRIGIDSNRKAISYQLKAKSLPSEDYVLQNFTKDEKEIIDKSVDKAVEILLEWINGKELEEKTVKIFNFDKS